VPDRVGRGIIGRPNAGDGWEDPMASTYRVEREQYIDAPPDAVRERVVDLRRWVSWSPWEQLDPNQQRTYGGPASGVGTWYAWKGNRKAGQGRMEIVEADASHVALDLRFVKPFKSQSVNAFRFEPHGEGTRVVWSMAGTNNLLMRLMGVFVSMEKLLAPDFEQGLANLKAESEAAEQDA
jgi:hypothetical protein